MGEGHPGYDALAVANWFLDRAAREPERVPPVDHLKLQKLVYIAHGLSLALHGRPLIVQDIQAWPYGPVVPEVYFAFRRYGHRPIDGRAMAEVVNGFNVERKPVLADFDADTSRLLERAWDAYKRYDGLQLSGPTHNPDTPWAAATRGRRRAEYAGETLRDADIGEYFKRLVRAPLAAAHAG